MYSPLEADSLYRQMEQQWEQNLLVCMPPYTTISMKKINYDSSPTTDFTANLLMMSSSLWMKRHQTNTSKTRCTTSAPSKTPHVDNRRTKRHSQLPRPHTHHSRRWNHHLQDIPETVQLLLLPHTRFMPTSQHPNKLCLLYTTTILPPKYLHDRLQALYRILFP